MDHNHWRQSPLNRTGALQGGDGEFWGIFTPFYTINFRGGHKSGGARATAASATLAPLVIRHYLRHLSFPVIANIQLRYFFTLVYTPGVFFLAQPMPRLTTPTITALDFPPLKVFHFHRGPPKQCCQILLYI